jgi:hypothetical protein
MKEQNYISNLFNDEKDFEGGLLRSLEITPPQNMHEIVMNKVRTTERRYRNKLLFRRYVSAAAAAFIFAIGIGTYFNRSINKESEVKIVSEINNQKEKVNIENIISENEKVDEKVEVTVKDNKTNVTKTNRQTKPVLKKNVKDSNVNNKENNAKESQKEDVLVVASSDKYDFKANDNNLQTSLKSTTLVYNYEIICSKENTQIVEYLLSNAVKVSEEIYSINKDKFEELKAFLSNNGIELKTVNEVSNDVNEINIKLVLK